LTDPVNYDPGEKRHSKHSSLIEAAIETPTFDLTGLRHMPLVTPRGEPVGVLEDADLLAASAGQSFLLRRSLMCCMRAPLNRIGCQRTQPVFCSLSCRP
jgi:hypothetical protein